MQQPPVASIDAGDRVGFGILSSVSAVFCFSMVDALAKWLGQDYAAVQILFFRCVFGLLPVAVFVWRSGGASCTCRKYVTTSDSMNAATPSTTATPRMKNITDGIARSSSPAKRSSRYSM